MFWLHFVSNNISLYRDTSEAIYRYVYTLYRCNSSTHYYKPLHNISVCVYLSSVNSAKFKCVFVWYNTNKHLQ